MIGIDAKPIYFEYPRFAWGSIPCVLCKGKGKDAHSFYIFPQLKNESYRENGVIVFSDEESRRHICYGKCFQCEAQSAGPLTVPALFNQHKSEYQEINLDRSSVARKFPHHLLFKRIPSIEKSLKNSDIDNGVLVARTHCRNCEKDKLSRSAYVCMREMVTTKRRNYVLWYRCARCDVAFTRCTPTILYWVTAELSTLEWVDMDRFQFYDRIGITTEIAEQYNRLVANGGTG